MSVIGKCNKCGGPIYEGDTRCSNCGEMFIVASKMEFPNPNPDPDPSPDPVRKSFQKPVTNQNWDSEREIRRDSLTESSQNSSQNSGRNSGQNSSQNTNQNLSQNTSHNSSQNTSQSLRQNTSQNSSQNTSQNSNQNLSQNSNQNQTTDNPPTPGTDRRIKYGIIAAGVLILTILITYLIKPGNDSSYEVVIKDCTWQQAFDESKAAGGHLITFETEKEFRTVTKEIDNHKLGDLRLYIGAARNDDSAEYYWISANNDMKGKMLNGESSFMYEKWEDNEPTFESDNGGRIENRVVFVHKLQGYWRIKDVCDDMIGAEPDLSGMTGYIIEYD